MNKKQSSPLTEPPTFGARLRQLRANLSIYALAQRSGVSRSFIGEIEKGKKVPSWDVAVKLAGALGVGIEEFSK